MKIKTMAFFVILFFIHHTSIAYELSLTNNFNCYTKFIIKSYTKVDEKTREIVVPNGKNNIVKIIIPITSDTHGDYIDVTAIPQNNVEQVNNIISLWSGRDEIWKALGISSLIGYYSNPLFSSYKIDFTDLPVTVGLEYDATGVLNDADTIYQGMLDVPLNPFLQYAFI